MEENLLIVHGGGPTAGLNVSLYGAVREAKKQEGICHIYAARNGTGGLLKKDFISDPFFIDKLFVSAFIKENGLVVKRNKLLKK